jgi:ribosome biogenesis GTPase / thiamine phosphate phosphatase
LEGEVGRAVLARPRGRNLDIVCGDRVLCENDDGQESIVAAVLPRRTVLRRSNLRGRPEALVANLTQLAPLLAPVPQPDPFLVDRYLAAAHSSGLKAVLVARSRPAGLAGGRA